MKKLFLLATCLFVFHAAPVLARSPANKGKPAILHLNPAAVRLQMANSREELVDVNNISTLIKYMRAFDKAETSDEQDQIVAEITSFCINRGLRPSPDVAAAFMAEARMAGSKGDWTSYGRFARYAASFAPHDPAAHLALAELGLKKGGILSGNFLYETIASFVSTFKNLQTRWVALANLAEWFRVTLFLLLGIIAILLFVKYQALLRHDVREWLGGGDSEWVRIAGLVALFLPALIFLSGFWWIIYWAGIFLLYAKWPERLVTILTVLLFIAAGVMSNYSYQNLYLSHLLPQASNIRSYANEIDTSLDGGLVGHPSTKNPLDKTFATLLSERYILHGSYIKAENLLSTLQKDYPGDAAVANNLGCIYFYENRYQEAIQQFSNALKIQSGMAAAYFNRSIAKNKVFNFTGSQEDQTAARKLDVNLFRAHNLIQSEDWSPILLRISLRQTRGITAKLAAKGRNSLSSAIKPGSSWFSMVFQPAFSLWSFLFVLGAMIAVFVKGSGFFAHACNKCGQPFCSRCKTSLEFESFCSQCVHLYIRQDGVSPEAKLKKNYQVEHFRKTRRIRRLVLGLLAPGAAHFLNERHVSAFVLLFLWCGLIAGFISRLFFLPISVNANVPTTPLHTGYLVFAGGLALVIWCIFGIPSALRRPPMSAPQGIRG